MALFPILFELKTTNGHPHGEPPCSHAMHTLAAFHYERFLNITHSFITKLKTPEKMRANRLQITTLRPAKWRMRTKGTILMRKAAMQDTL